VQARIFDFDNHYYESEDALTRHQDRALGNRGVRWADVGGRRRLLVGGKINSYVANPTFDPVARPGSLYHWYRGNPRRQKITEAFASWNRSGPSTAIAPRACGSWTSRAWQGCCCSRRSASESRKRFATTLTPAPGSSTDSTSGSTRTGAIGTRDG